MLYQDYLVTGNITFLIIWWWSWLLSGRHNASVFLSYSENRHLGTNIIDYIIVHTYTYYISYIPEKQKKY